MLGVETLWLVLAWWLVVDSEGALSWPPPVVCYGSRSRGTRAPTRCPHVGTPSGPPLAPASSPRNSQRSTAVLQGVRVRYEKYIN